MRPITGFASVREFVPLFFSFKHPMTLFAEKLRLLGVHQDLLWFLVLMGWCFAATLWWRVPARRTDWVWLPWAAAAGILTTLVQFFSFNPPFEIFHELLIPGAHEVYEPAVIPPDLLADIVLAGGFFAILALWWNRVRRTGQDRWLCIAMIALCVIAAPLHVDVPRFGAWLLAALPLVALAQFWWRNPPTRLAGGGLLLTGLLPLLSPVGPLAMLAGKAQRDGATAWFGAVCALAHLIALALILTGLLRDKLHAMDRPDRRALQDDVRPFWQGGAIWLTLGLGAALLGGADNVKEIKVNRMRLTAARAHDVPGNLVDRLRIPITDEPAVRSALEHLSTSLPFLKDARFIVRDGDELVAIGLRDDAITTTRLGPMDATRLQKWSAAQPDIISMPVPEAWAPYYTRVPLKDSQGHMAGWLEFKWVEFYMTLARKWRTGPLLVTALGAVLAAVFFVQRRSSREREEALRAAAVAAEAGRVKIAFLAKVSHELRTPLQSILGYAELLQRNLPGNTERKQIEALHHHGQLMTRLVNDLIDLSALESGAFRLVDEPVPLPEIVQQTAESFRPRAEAKGLSLSISIAPDVPAWVTTDAGRLRQLLLNLMGNAVKFTRTGSITVSLTTTANGQTELAVRDTGPGIAAEDQARVFEPFARLALTAQEEGTGLGLALVAGLARSMGGTVAVESAPGHGSCFRLKLPLRLAAAPVSASVIETTTRLQGLRVLIADDNDLVRTLFTTYLNSLGAKCLVARNGREALEVAGTSACDVIVLDLAMPEIDGTEVTRRLRAAGSTVRIIGVSAHTDVHERNTALAAGMDLFLTKPLELSALGEAIAGGGSHDSMEEKMQLLRTKLAKRFRAELPTEIERIETALRDHDRATVRDAAHRLKNSAFVVGDDSLGRAAAELERAADAADQSALTTAWNACTAALESWSTTTKTRTTA